MPRLLLVQKLSGHLDRTWKVAWNPQGTILASCGGDKSVRLWGTEGEKWICKTILTEGHQRTIRSVAWSPCGNFLASASFDGTVCIWDKKSGDFECNATLEGHENEVKSVSWASSGNILATCSRDKSVWIWEVEDDNDEYECASVLNSHTQDVKQVAWHPHLPVLASASYDNTIKLYKEEGDDWVQFASLESHDSTVWAVSFDKSGERLASCSDDKTIKIWKEYKPGNKEGIMTDGENSSWHCICTLSGYHSRTIYDISWCHLSGLVATASGDDSIKVFQEDPNEIDENQPIFSMTVNEEKAHSQDVNSVNWNPKIMGLLASAGDDGEVRLWQYVDD